VHGFAHKTVPIILRIALDDRLCRWRVRKRKHKLSQTLRDIDTFFAPIFNGHHTINPERLSISLVSRLISFFDNDVKPASNDGKNVKSVVELAFSMLSPHILEDLPATSGRTRVGFRVANFGSGACRDALTRSLSSTARRPSLLSLQVFR
jgi:hypothetical protein